MHSGKGVHGALRSEASRFSVSGGVVWFLVCVCCVSAWPSSVHYELVYSKCQYIIYHPSFSTRILVLSYELN